MLGCWANSLSMRNSAPSASMKVSAACGDCALSSLIRLREFIRKCGCMLLRKSWFSSCWARAALLRSRSSCASNCAHRGSSKKHTTRAKPPSANWLPVSRNRAHEASAINVPPRLPCRRRHRAPRLSARLAARPVKNIDQQRESKCAGSAPASAMPASSTAAASGQRGSRYAV
ncbi:hypothetical protein D3C81_1589310 [compost metagenome]